MYSTHVAITVRGGRKLDNVTTLLLLTPIIVRLVQLTDSSPVPVLISVTIVSNIGGCATAVGDPPMTMIINTSEVHAAGIGFNEILFYMAPCTVFMIIITIVFLKIFYRKEFHKKPVVSPAVMHLRKEIEIWKSTCKRLSNDAEDEHVQSMLTKHIRQLEKQLKKTASQGDTAVNIKELEQEYKIRNIPIFVCVSIVVGLVVFGFFIENFLSEWIHISMAWTAELGALAILVIADFKELDHILEKVEWATLLFFATLFVMMEGLGMLGIIDALGSFIISIIEIPGSPFLQLVCAITLIIWLSSFMSAFIDSIPYTTAMIPMVISLTRDPLNLPMKPLVFALAFGTGLGGNGSLIGTTANLVMAGLSEKQGHHIGFVTFFKPGFPVMLLTTFIANVYLLIVHVVFGIGLDGFHLW